MSESNIGYDDLYSKVRRIYISLPDFKFFHRPSKINDVDSHFVGRERIIALLKNWLDDKNGNHTGSYLITGYRGMGKTSFVGKVIDEMVEKQRANGFKVQLRKKFDFLGKFLQMGRFDRAGRAIEKDAKKIDWLIQRIWRLLVNMLPAIAIFVYNIILRNPFNKVEGVALGCYVVVLLMLVLLYFKKYRPNYILSVKINISNEVANTKDVLALIVYSIRNKLFEYFEEKTAVLPLIVFARCVLWTCGMCVAALLHDHLMVLLQSAADGFYVDRNTYFLTYIFSAVNRVFYTFLTEYPGAASVVGGLILILAVYCLRRIVIRPLLFLLECFGRPIRTPRWFVMQLNDICNRIDTEVRESGDPYNMSLWGLTLSFKQKASKQYGRASVREIEQSLINVIEKIHTSWILNCRLIIILDELDKLNRFDNRDKTDAVEFPEFTSNENGISEETSQQDKKHRILSLLGQLKYFINTAKAKFIFIAGHELYDAYLADVSDREYSISSIFNGVINVDSFFTCNSRTKDITKLTETYLCKQLMGTSGRPETPTYNLAECRKIYSSNRECELDKVLVFLRQFITYLTFVSNGAPKKLTAHFEEYVISEDEFKRQGGRETNGISRPIVLEISSSQVQPSFYLSFGYYDQQKIGFIHYLAYPIFENIISPSSEYGDKLLIASSFLIAHIYKHHTSGFSWRNLEYLPELIDSNRTPELREFINSIIGYLGQIHLTTITSGIYTYKFPMRLVEEISVFTKKSEELSAIFNFSLDYSLAVKKYYYRLLDFYRQKQDSSEIVKASLRHNIGDIHMANDEYTEAIVQFRHITDSIEKRMRELKTNPKENMASLIVRYMRIMLKLGLAYEKRNTIDSAYLVYSNLMTRLVAHREINEDVLNLRYKIAKEDGKKYFGKDFRHGRRVILLPSESCSMGCGFHRTCYPKPYMEKEDEWVKFWIYGDELTDNLCDFLTPDKEALITKLSVYEDLRMAYLPILAKLFAIEKHNICGITRDNVRVAEAEFQYLYLITNSRDKYLLHVDFYRKLGDILYYKNNCLFSGERNSAITLLSFWGYDLKDVVFDYCYRENYSKSKIESIMSRFNFALNVNEITTEEKFEQALADGAAEWLKPDVAKIVQQIPEELRCRIGAVAACGKRRGKLKNIPCSACRYYDRSLALLKAEVIEDLSAKSEAKYKKISKVFLFLDAIYCKNTGPRLVTWRYNNLTQIALTLDAMGNTLLSCTSDADRIDVRFLNDLFRLQSEKRLKKQLAILKKFRDCETDLSKTLHFKKLLLYFWAAMKYHEKAGNNKESVQCLLKILKVIVSYLSKYPNERRCRIDTVQIEAMLSWAINQLYSTPVFYNIREVGKLRKIVNKRINMSMTSIMPEVEELLLAYYEIELEEMRRSRNENAYLEQIGIFYGSPSLSYLRNDSLTYNRVVSLLFKAKLNERLFEKLGLRLFKSPGKSEKNGGVFDNIDGQKVEAIVQKCLHMTEEDGGDKYKLLEFLMADSIFCLANITDFILPTGRTTLFTNSFCQAVYERLFHWIRWKEAYEETGKDNENKTRLEKTLAQLIEKHHDEMLKPTYLKEMANRHCTAAREMQNEGDDYQDFIKGLYLLDDDLQNNTCQFYFALERYKINSGKLNPMETELVNDYYKPKQYYGMLESNSSR